MSVFSVLICSLNNFRLIFISVYITYDYYIIVAEYAYIEIIDTIYDMHLKFVEKEYKRETYSHLKTFSMGCDSE